MYFAVSLKLMFMIIFFQTFSLSSSLAKHKRCHPSSGVRQKYPEDVEQHVVVDRTDQSYSVWFLSYFKSYSSYYLTYACWVSTSEYWIILVLHPLGNACYYFHRTFVPSLSDIRGNWPCGFTELGHRYPFNPWLKNVNNKNGNKSIYKFHSQIIYLGIECDYCLKFNMKSPRLFSL